MDPLASVFPARFRLDARRDRRGNWAFDLRVQADWQPVHDSPAG